MPHPLVENSVCIAGGLQVLSRVGGRADPADAPVVCVHGAVVSGRYMTPLASRLAARRRVHVPDLPGYGHSDDPPDPLRVPGLADAVRAYMDAAGIEQAHLLGNSLGAQVVADLASRAPDRTASAILVGPTVDRRARTRVGQLWRLAKDAFLERPSLIPLHVTDILRAGPRFAIASLDIALEDRIEDKVAAVTSPMLIVSGTRDPLVPPDWSAHLAALAPRARLDYIDGPHALNYSRPVELAQLVEEFLADIERASGVAPEPGHADRADAADGADRSTRGETGVARGT